LPKVGSLLSKSRFFTVEKSVLFWKSTGDASVLSWESTGVSPVLCWFSELTGETPVLLDGAPLFSRPNLGLKVHAAHSMW